MKILIIGANGLLGKAVTNELKEYQILTPTSVKLDITLIHISTDYVFDGKKT